MKWAGIPTATESDPPVKGTGWDFIAGLPGILITRRGLISDARLTVSSIYN